MRRLIMLGLAGLAATVLPLPAADGSVARTTPSALGTAPCSLIPVPAATAPVGSGGCPGVRPGGGVVTRLGLCTLNFLFRAPDGTRYISTAGHCIGTSEGATGDPHEKVWPPGSGPPAIDPDGRKFGEFAYGAIQSHGTGFAITYTKDFALIRLDPGVEASPEMCYFGGPRGLFTTDATGPLALRYYGNGDNVLPARTAVAQGTPDPDHVYATGVAQPGDGGSPVMTADGMALGVLVTFSPHGVGFSTEPGGPGPAYLESQQGTIGLTRLAPQLARASATLGVPLELVTADQ